MSCQKLMQETCQGSKTPRDGGRLRWVRYNFLDNSIWVGPSASQLGPGRMTYIPSRHLCRLVAEGLCGLSEKNSRSRPLQITLPKTIEKAHTKKERYFCIQGQICSRKAYVLCKTLMGPCVSIFLRTYLKGPFYLLHQPIQLIWELLQLSHIYLYFYNTQNSAIFVLTPLLYYPFTGQH